MKSLRKILAVLVATAMVAGMGVMAFGEGTNNRVADGSVVIYNLNNGDEVQLYQILKFDSSKSGTGGWATGDGYSGTISDDDIRKIINHSGTYPNTATDGLKSGTAGIDFSDAHSMAGKLSGTPAKVQVSGSTFTQTVEPGLYMAVITSAKPSVLYNPVFVSSDYFQSGTSGTNAWTLIDEAKSYANNAVAKKQILDVSKDATRQKNNNDGSGSSAPATGGDTYQSNSTANVGDDVTFEVKTTVPTFTEKYIKPIFNLTDSLTSGLKMNSGTVQVKGKSGSDTYDYSFPAGAFKVSYNAGYDGFKIEFDQNFLKNNKIAIPILVTYTAQVTNEAVSSVNQDKNTITLNFSNGPDDQSGSAILEDETKHYTFSIDASLLGESGTKSTEIVKVGLDPDGKELSGTFEISSGTFVGALQNAKFKFEVESGTNNYVAYTNGISGSNYNQLISDADGRILIQGLDGGKYKLQEIEAPAGYVIDPNPYYIEIKPVFETKTITKGSGSGQYSYSLNVLQSYSVWVNGSKTAEYTITNENSGTEITSVAQVLNIGKSGTIEKGSNSGTRLGKIQNTQGVALPSTGGVGTTLFYAGGAVLVLLAGVLLVSKRRIA